MPYTLPSLDSATAIVSRVSKKRSPEAAFPQSSLDDTVQTPKSPSRTHTQKRPRFKNLMERPSYVSPKDVSIQVKYSLSVTVMCQGRQDVGEALLGDVLGGSDGSSTTPEFSVLCFFGDTIEHLRHLSQVSSLLGNLNALVFGVSLSPPPRDISPIPIIHDHTRSLTLHLGLMHPLGGGRQTLDAIVVLDREFRRRMLLPVGWGTPQGAANPKQSVLNDDNGVLTVVRDCVKGVEWLAGEREEEIDMDVEMGGIMDMTA